MRYYGDPVLRQVAQRVEVIDEQVEALADDMVRLLTLRKGYGLAAPQVGVSARIILLDVEDFFQIVVNPEIVSVGEEEVLGIEGCLSIPGAEAEVLRYRDIEVKGQTLEGERFELHATELLARVFQHEIDHLNGVLFVDHLGDAKRLQVLKDFEKRQGELKA